MLKKNKIKYIENSLIRWVAIYLFLFIPIIFILILKPVPDLPDEFDEKILSFQSKQNIDTVVIGDSRVLRLKENEFKLHGWNFYNMGLPGLSPTDIVNTLNFTMNKRSIRRVILGVSFENMTEFSPGEFSRYSLRFKQLPLYIPKDDFKFTEIHNEGPYQEIKYFSQDKGIIEKAKKIISISNGLQDIADKVLLKIASLINTPVRQASDKLHMLLNIYRIESLPQIILADGSASYSKIQEEINNGTYNFEYYRNVNTYWNRQDGESRYLEKKELSNNSKSLYLNLIDNLKDKKIPLIIFETSKIPQYQLRIDSDPVLAKLQQEWRNFYRVQQNPCVKFLDTKDLIGIYDPSDFFDATHFIGETENRLAKKIAYEMKVLENKCFQKN